MFLAFLTLLTALAISAVAIYYSVAGLVTIFSAAAIPIMIMGSVLEIGKLVTAVWLHRYWHQTVWWLKTYLSIAVIVLMFITSMGIFGFLSRAHIEQTANAAESLQLIVRIDSEIERESQSIVQAESIVQAAQGQSRTQEAVIQSQIDREQDRINSAYVRIQPAIDEQLAAISSAEQAVETRTTLFLDQITEIDQFLADLQSALAANDIRRVQGIIGERQDGAFGPATSAAVQNYRDTLSARRNELINRAESVRNQPNISVDAGRSEIARLRSIAEQEIADSNTLISRLRSQLGIDNTEEIKIISDQQQQIINSARATIENLQEQKFQLEIDYRLIEAEVGPIKYIAEFVYGSADADLLEAAVRWVIIIIIFVFDPLAVLLLIASQYTFESHRREKRESANKEIPNEIANGPNNEQPDSNSETLPGSDPGSVTASNAEITDLHSSTDSADGRELAGTSVLGEPVAEDQKKSIEFLEELNSEAVTEEEQARLQSWNEKIETLKEAKHIWKEQHPDETMKFYKTLYIKGKIEKLPWEEETYVQNSEQTDNSLFKKLQQARLKK